MSNVIIAQRWMARGGTAADLAAVNEVPLERELILETDSGRIKRGDGVTHYNDLPYIGPGEIDFTGLADGDTLVWDAAAGKFKVGAPGGGGSMVLVGSATVAGSPATSLAMVGLNLAADGCYVIRVSLKNASASANAISLHLNGDTTAVNYNTQFVTGTGTVSGGGFSTPTIVTLDASNVTVSELRMQRDLDGRARTMVTSHRSGMSSTLSLQLCAHLYRTVANVTGISLTGNQANGLAVGCSATVWRLN